MSPDSPTRMTRARTEDRTAGGGRRGWPISWATIALIVAATGVVAPALAGRSAAPGVRKAYSGSGPGALKVKLSKPFSFGRAFTYDVKLTCSDGSTFTDAPFLDDVRIKANGRFRVRHVSEHRATITDVRGAIRGRRAHGTIKIAERYAATPGPGGNYPLSPRGTVLCRTGRAPAYRVSWSARAR